MIVCKKLRNMNVYYFETKECRPIYHNLGNRKDQPMIDRKFALNVIDFGVIRGRN